MVKLLRNTYGPSIYISVFIQFLFKKTGPHNSILHKVAWYTVGQKLCHVGVWGPSFSLSPRKPQTCCSSGHLPRCLCGEVERCEDTVVIQLIVNKTLYDMIKNYNAQWQIKTMIMHHLLPDSLSKKACSPLRCGRMRFRYVQLAKDIVFTVMK